VKMKEPYYKGFQEYWAPSYMLKEFDKIAVKPGVNWKGNVEKWVDNAQAAGWITKTDPHDAKIGALVIRINPTINQTKVDIVREIKGNLIVVDCRKGNLYPYTETLQMDDLKKDKQGFNFIGYIWPVREEKIESIVSSEVQ